jgi:hypothetical protein
MLAVSDNLIPALPGKDFEYEMDELRLLFKKLAVFSWLTDSLK